MKNTLVFGASLKPDRYSNLVVRRLSKNGENTFAFGHKTGWIGDVQVKTNLDELPTIDIVTLYLNPSRQTQYYDMIIALQPKKVIFNPGTENIEFYGLLQENQISVEVACTLVLLSTNQYGL